MTAGARRKKSWAVRLGLLVGVTLVSFALAELALRAIGFRYALYPERIEFGFPNPQEMESGFVADDELLWVKKDYEETVARAVEERPPLVFMGCSCTDWGRYDDGLAKLVAERQGGRRLEFVNIACAGWSSYQGLQQMRTDVARIAPEVVTIFFGWNDHWIGFGVDDATAAELNQSILFPLQKLRLVQLLNKFVLGREAPAAGGRKPLRVSPEDFRRNLEEMVELARSYGSTPVLLTAPTSQRTGSEPAYLEGRWLEKLDELVPLHQRYVAIVREVASEKGVPLCDLEASFATLPDERVRTLFRDDGIHFTDRGVALVAEQLYRCFLAEGLFDRLLGGA